MGWKALRAELSAEALFAVPLDSLVADTQGSLGYMIQRALREELLSRGLVDDVVTLVTEVEVAADEKATSEPTKPIGRFFPEEEAKALAAEHGWTMAEDGAQRGWRRVVPSPRPMRIVQLESIGALANLGTIVICCGGGGIPVVRRAGWHPGAQGCRIQGSRLSWRWRQIPPTKN